MTPHASTRIPAIAKLILLIGVAIAAFSLSWLPALAALALAPLLGFWAASLPLQDLARLFRKLLPFLGILTLSNLVMVPEGMPWEVHLKQALALSAVMGLRILAVVLSSMLVQKTGQPGELVRAMRQIGLPRTVAAAVDLTLAMFHSPGSGRGRGNGSGGGRRHAAFSIKELVAGRVDDLKRLVRDRLAEAEARVAQDPELPAGSRRDLAVIVGLTLAGLSVKAFKVLPGIPIAPGHKGVILLPLYILAAALTQGRWGATTLGITLGLVSFLFGDGQFGPLEIAKHVAPGMVIDMLWPLSRRLFPELRPVVYAVLGLTAALARLSTMLLVGVLVGAPPAFFALLLPMALFHLGFGAASGIVTYYLLGAFGPASLPSKEDPHV